MFTGKCSPALGIFLSLALGTALSACSPQVQAVPPTVTLTLLPPAIRVTIQPTAASPTLLPSLTAPPTSTTAPPFQVCTPLAEHPLGVLREIVSDPYHPPPMGKDDRHQGVDFSYYRHGERTTIQGVQVQAVLPGRVAASLADTWPFGNLVIIETRYADLPDALNLALGIQPDQSLYLLYAHMEQPPLVSLGQMLAACQAIGLVGHSGNAVEPHLHLETRLGPPGLTLDSMGYYQVQHTEQEKANYLLWRTSGTYQHLDPMRLINWGLGTPSP